METVKLTIALVPVSMLLYGSVVLFRTRQSMWVSFQLIGSAFLVVVVLTHICEALSIFHWMHWGLEDSIGHYLDLVSAVLGLTLFPIGYCFTRAQQGSPKAIRHSPGENSHVASRNTRHPMTERPDLPSLAWALLRIGAVAFGGLGATLTLLNRDLVERRGWLRSSDVSEALAYTKPLPGSTVVQVVTFLGWRLGGWPGAIVATVMFLLPAFAIMTLAAAVVLALPDALMVRSGLTGLQVAVVGILAAAMWRLARSEAGSVPLMMVLIAAFAIGLLVNAALIVGVAGAIGVAFDRVKRYA
jgi:chromate transporter